MKSNFKSVGSNNLIQKWSGRENVISPLGYEMRMSPEDEPFKGFVDYLYSWKQEIIDQECPSDTPEYIKLFKRNKEQFIKDCEGAKPRITIRIELEKYEE